MGTRIMQARSSLPVGLLARAVLQLPRDDMERLAQSLIDRLDAMDGDADDEDDDPAEEDDHAGQCDEDGINTALHVLAQIGAGCVVSDDDFAECWAVPRFGIDQTVCLPGTM